MVVIGHRRALETHTLVRQYDPRLSVVLLHDAALELEPDERNEIYEILTGEISRLDQLINQLLEAGRLDDIGQDHQVEAIELLPMIVGEAQSAAVRHGHDLRASIRFDGEPVETQARRIMLEIIFSNLIDNAFKYGGQSETPPVGQPEIVVAMSAIGAATVQVRIASNSPPVRPDDRRRIFRIFERGGSELERRQKGTGLGLYIVHTLVRRLRGAVHVQDRSDRRPGAEFVVTLPGRRCDEPAFTLADAANQDNAGMSSRRRDDGRASQETAAEVAAAETHSEREGSEEPANSELDVVAQQEAGG